MAKVIPIGNVTKLDIPPDRILENSKGQYEGIVLFGFGKDGNFIASSSYADGGTIMWLIESLKNKLMGVG